MNREVYECFTELQKNHTDREIGGALSEYFQIVKNVAAEYPDEATVRDLRDDHPELDFMDNDELEDILKHAKTWRHKLEAQEPDKRLSKTNEVQRRPGQMMDVRDVKEALSVSESTAYGVIRRLNQELEKAGYITVRGKVSRAYFEKRTYGVSVNAG